MTKDLLITDWESQLQDGDVVTRNEGQDSFPVVLLAGLQRMAREAGMIHQDVTILTPSENMVQAVFKATFEVFDPNMNLYRNMTFVGTADCNRNNTQGKYANYPTAVAESRAEARCLRKALGIKILSSEEVGLREGVGSLEASPKGKAPGSLIAAIEKLCENRGIDAAVALGAALDDNRASSIFELSELNTKEAQAVMSWLNEQKPTAKPSSKRDARKAELQSKQEK